MGFEEWMAGLEERHLADLRFAEVTRALRALSSTYVERRERLESKSAFDSAGKRAAYALYYSPLHFLTVRHVMNTLGAGVTVANLLDVGCGAGAAGVAWALTQEKRTCHHRNRLASVGARRSRGDLPRVSIDRCGAPGSGGPVDGAARDRCDRRRVGAQRDWRGFTSGAAAGARRRGPQPAPPSRHRANRDPRVAVVGGLVNAIRRGRWPARPVALSSGAARCGSATRPRRGLAQRMDYRAYVVRVAKRIVTGTTRGPGTPPR